MERFISPCPPPTGLRRELIEKLIDECSEVIQRCSKALTFGLDEIQPGQEYSNSRRIAFEVGDVYEVVRRLNGLRVLDVDDIEAGVQNKRRKLAQFLQHEE